MTISCTKSSTDLRDDVAVDASRVLDFDGEPSLDELLDDPVIQAVMAQDRVERQDIVDIVASLQSAFFR